MKIYIRSATLTEIEKLAVNLLKTDSVSTVEVVSRSSTGMKCKLHYKDGTVSSIFSVMYTNKPTRSLAKSEWNPSWYIKDDGSVVNESGKLMGYFKLLKKPRQETSANYLEDELTVYYGTRSIDLNEDSAATISDMFKPSD